MEESSSGLIWFSRSPIKRYKEYVSVKADDEEKGQEKEKPEAEEL